MIDRNKQDIYLYQIINLDQICLLYYFIIALFQADGKMNKSNTYDLTI